MTIFLSVLGLSPHSPPAPTPQQCCGQKALISNFNFVWGGRGWVAWRGGVTSFTNISF